MWTRSLLKSNAKQALQGRFPGVFSVDTNPVLGVVGAAVAGGLAWKKCPIIVCVLAAVAVEAVMLLVQGSGMLWSVVVVA